MIEIFCPQCNTLILDQPSCPACGWRGPAAADGAGELIWRADLGRTLPKTQAAAVIANGIWCLSAEDATLTALDVADGRITWQQQIDAQQSYSLASDGQRLLASPADLRSLPVARSSLLALDADTGAELWRYATAGHSLSAAAAERATGYFASSDGRLHAIDTTNGQGRWQVKHDGWGPGAPAAGAGLVCAGGRRTMLTAYTSEHGVALWSFAAEGWFAGAIVIEHTQVYALCWDGYLYALEASTGKLRWKFKGERGEGITSAPVVANGRIFVGSRVFRASAARSGNGYALLALNVADGAELWRFATAKHITAAPAIAGDTVVFGADDGMLYALDAHSGQERWQFKLDARVVAAPLLISGIAYIGTRSGLLYAIRCQAPPSPALEQPQVYQQRGEFEQAAVAYALHGHLGAAAAIYENMLKQPTQAAQLYERAGQLSQAAVLWEAERDLRRARELYQQAGQFGDVARMLERSGEPLGAAKIYEQIGESVAAARLYEQAGNRSKAADLYHQSGDTQAATQIWRSLDQWERLADALIDDGKLDAAARILEQHNQIERAADLYEPAGQLDQALRLRVGLEQWERVADLALRLEDYAQEAAALERFGQLLQAAGAYERAAQQLITANSADERRIASYYERAAQHYSDVFEEARAEFCHNEVRRYRHLPVVTITGGAQAAFVEYEWNVLRLRVRNTGYGAATNITISFQGTFDIDASFSIARLGPKKTAPVEVSLRPQRDQYGPAVPLEISVAYQDVRGGQYSTSRRTLVRVLQRGAEDGSTTPLEIQTQTDRRPPQQESEQEQHEEAAGASQEQIEEQQNLLAIHRRNLALYLEQRAQLGQAFIPPGIANGIYAERQEIRRIKEILRDWDVRVENYPDDRAAR